MKIIKYNSDVLYIFILFAQGAMAHWKRWEHDAQGNLDLQVREALPPMIQPERGIMESVSSTITHLVTNYESKIKIGGTEVWFSSNRNRIKRDADWKITELELKVSGNNKTLVVFKVYIEDYVIKHKKKTKNHEEYDFIDTLVIHRVVKVSQPRIFGDKDGHDIQSFRYFRYLEGTLRLPWLIEKIKTELSNAILHFSRNSL